MMVAGLMAPQKCESLLDVKCPLANAKSVIANPADAVVGGTLNAFAKTVQDGIGWVVRFTFTSWLSIDSPNLMQEDAVSAIQAWILPFAAPVAFLAILLAGARMALTRKPTPLLDIGRGLIVITATTALGVLLPTVLLDIGDNWSDWVLKETTDGQFADRLAKLLGLVAVASAATANPAPVGAVITLGVIALIMCGIQALLMIFRQAALVILCGLLPLAAAGSLAPATKSWLPKIAGWMLALIFYKPAAAAVYATGFTMLGEGNDPRTIFAGFVMLVTSLIAFPVLLKFFTWAAGAVTISNPSGGLLSAAIGGATAIGAFRDSSGGSGGLSPVDQANFIENNGPGSQPAPTQPSGNQDSTEDHGSPNPIQLANQASSNGSTSGSGGHLGSPSMSGSAETGGAGTPTSAQGGHLASSSLSGSAGSTGTAAASGATAAGMAAAAPVALAVEVPRQVSQMIGNAMRAAATALTDEPDGSE